MPLHKFDPQTLYPVHGLYHNAVEVPSGTSLVFSSGIIGADAQGQIVADAEGQIGQVWRNVRAFLAGIDARPEDLVRLKNASYGSRPSCLQQGCTHWRLGKAYECGGDRGDRRAFRPRALYRD